MTHLIDQFVAKAEPFSPVLMEKQIEVGPVSLLRSQFKISTGFPGMDAVTDRDVG